jgi:hypothetical protein
VHVVEVEVDARGSGAAGGHSDHLLQASPDSVCQLLRAHEDDADTTITITHTNGNERRLMIAYSNGIALAGLVEDDKVWQLNAGKDAPATDATMIIGGQDTRISARHVISSGLAFMAAEDFLSGRPFSDRLQWDQM